MNGLKAKGPAVRRASPPLFIFAARKALWSKNGVAFLGSFVYLKKQQGSFSRPGKRV